MARFRWPSPQTIQTWYPLAAAGAVFCLWPFAAPYALKATHSVALFDGGWLDVVLAAALLVGGGVTLATATIDSGIGLVPQDGPSTKRMRLETLGGVAASAVMLSIPLWLPEPPLTGLVAGLCIAAMLHAVLAGYRLLVWELQRRL